MDGGGDSWGQAIKNDTMMGPSPSLARLGKIINKIVESYDAPNMFIFMKNKDEFNEERTPCLLISASPYAPALPLK